MYKIPTLKELYDSILSNIQQELGVEFNSLGKYVLIAIASVQAAKIKLIYLMIAKLQKNIFVDTADSELKGGTLERFGRIKIGRDPFQATFAKYQCQVNGTIGATIKALTTFISDDTSLNPSVLFILENDFVLITGYDTIELKALESGTIGKLSINDKLTATSPLLNVDNSVIVTSELIAPTNKENIEEYRQKVINSFRVEPQGGSSADYILWSKDAIGCKAVYPFAKSGGNNEVNLYVEANVNDSTDGFGTPSNSILDNVESVVNLDPDSLKPLSERGRKPLNVIVNYLPIIPKSVIITIVNTNLTANDQSLIFEAIKQFIDSVRPFVSSSDILENKNDLINGYLIGNVINGVVPNAIYTGITINVDSVDTTFYQFIESEIPYLQNLIFA